MTNKTDNAPHKTLKAEPSSARLRPAKNPNLHVMKFGGTSVKNIQRIQHVAEIIQKRLETGPVVVVVSAMGDTTDYLVKLAGQCAKKPDQRELDLLLSTGEQISITLLAMVLRDMGIKAKSFTAYQVGIFTESVHNKARIVDVDTDALLNALEQNQVLVVAGFQGVTSGGDITTLGRGGSDTTAVALAAAVGAEVCDIYTDVTGIYTADPNKIASAKMLPRISFEEVLEMARLGAQVIHPRAVELAMQYDVKLRVRSTFKPEDQGTLIDGGSDVEIYRTVSGLAVDKNQASVCIMDVPDRPGVAGEILRAVAEKKIVIDMIMQAFNPTAGLNSITFTVASDDLDETVTELKRITEKVGAKSVLSDPDIAKVSLIGMGLGGRPEVAATLFTVFGNNGINIKMISSSEKKLTCAISAKDADRAAELIHEAFDLGKVAEPVK